MTLAADLASPASSVTQIASAPFPSCRTSRHASAFYTWGGHSFSKWQKLIPLSWSIVDLFRTRARACTTTSLCEKSQITIFLTRGHRSRSAANSGIAYSRTLKRPTPSGMGAVYGRPRHKHLRFLFWYIFPVLPLWLLRFLLSPLSWTSGGAGSSHEVSFANT